MTSRRSAMIFAVTMVGALGVAEAWRPRRFISDSAQRIDVDQLVPATFGNWKIDPRVIPLQAAPDLQKVIEETYDATLARTYVNAAGQSVMLSMAYGRNQHDGMNSHRPEICYPAQGLSIRRNSEQASIEVFGHGLPVTRMVAGHGGRNEPITYWLRVGDSITHFGRDQKWVTLRYGLRGLIPDGMLVRLSSIDESAPNAFQIQEAFAQDLMAAVSAPAREAMLGAAFLRRPQP
jgi:EpsI family protein